MAHRGGAEWAPNLGKENTLAAFRQVAGLGYRYIETDLQVTRDGQLVCLHDLDLARLTGEPGRVADRTYRELTRLRVGGEPIPRLADVLDDLPGVRFNVDLKTPGTAEALAALLRSNPAHDRLLVASFSARRLARFRRLTTGTVATGMATLGVVSTLLVPGVWWRTPGEAVQSPVSSRVGPVTIHAITATTVARAHRRGRVVHVWTIDDPAEMETLIDLGVDGIVTDRPDVLKDVLERRGLWDA